MVFLLAYVACGPVSIWSIRGSLELLAGRLSAKIHNARGKRRDGPGLGQSLENTDDYKILWRLLHETRKDLVLVFFTDCKRLIGPPRKWQDNI